MIRQYDRPRRKELLLKTNISKSVDPSISSLRLTGELQVVFKLSLAGCLLQAHVVFCPSHKLGVSKLSISTPMGEET